MRDEGDDYEVSQDSSESPSAGQVSKVLALKLTAVKSGGRSGRGGGSEY